jgi:ankyrin repeat protein
MISPSAHGRCRSAEREFPAIVFFSSVTNLLSARYADDGRKQKGGRMSTNSEASRLNLEYYRKQAKALLKAAQAGDPGALDRISRPATKFDPAAPKLHDAQLTIAREQGFASWPRFRNFVVQSGLDFQKLVAAFLDAALSDLRRAEEMLAAHPKIGGAGFHVALVLGDRKGVERALAEMPSLATGRGGPQNWEPILYVCFSRFGHAVPSRAGGLAETARILLRHGANPNAAFTPEDLPGNSLSCLYGATGLNNNPALGLALLEAGANPNDSESLYHSTEHRDLACMKLLLRYGATPAGANALKHMLDREDLDGLQILLAAGGDPNEVNDRGETALHWAVWRGRSAAIAAALLDSGADADAQRNDGRTAYALAVQSGQTEVASLLRARGAKTDIPALDRFLGECAAADPEDLSHLLASGPQIAMAPGSERLLADLTAIHRTTAVRALLAAGMPVDAREDMGATALHWACWKGYADLVELLLGHGASLTIEDREFHGTPAGWFGHGVRNCNEGAGDYARVARLLIAAGATIPAVDLPTGHPAVDAVLRERGLI